MRFPHPLPYTRGEFSLQLGVRWVVALALEIGPALLPTARHVPSGRHVTAHDVPPPGASHCGTGLADSRIIMSSTAAMFFGHLYTLVYTAVLDPGLPSGVDLARLTFAVVLWVTLIILNRNSGERSPKSPASKVRTARDGPMPPAR